MIEDVLKKNFTKISPEYRQFALEKDACRACPLYDHYQQTAQSEGNAKDPTFVFIGEAYGADEVENMRPFFGVAGQRLREELRKYPEVFTRDSTLITNTLSCRPPNNKFPTDVKTVESCYSKWLRRELQLLKPQIIITLGSHSLLQVRKQKGITSVRGTWLFLNEFRAWSMATYHPSYVLRCRNDAEKQYVEHEFAEDIKNIAESWQYMVDHDPRMQMSEEEWRIHKTFAVGVEIGLIKGKPIAK